MYAICCICALTDSDSVNKLRGKSSLKFGFQNSKSVDS